MSEQKAAVPAEELLRLARKVWPGEDFEVWSDGELHRVRNPWSSPVACFPPRGLSAEEGRALARRAEYAALLVLAGEPRPDIATAEARGRAAERADVGAWLREERNSDTRQGLICDLLPELEAGEHVGAAGGREAG